MYRVVRLKLNPFFYADIAENNHKNKFTKDKNKETKKRKRRQLKRFDVLAIYIFKC